ncbi:MAG: PhnD/SsuA/transferrin family substrate-binding protein [Rhodospirillales bacterium]
MLLEAGLVSDRDYNLRVLGAHGAVAMAVANGKADAGGLSMPIFNRLIREQKLDPATVRVLADSPPIPEYMWTFREGLDPAFKEEIRKGVPRCHRPGAAGVPRRRLHPGGRLRCRPGPPMGRGDRPGKPWGDS